MTRSNKQLKFRDCLKKADLKRNNDEVASVRNKTAVFFKKIRKKLSVFFSLLIAWKFWGYLEHSVYFLLKLYII